MLIFNGGRIANPPRTSAKSRPNGDEATSSQIISLPQWGGNKPTLSPSQREGGLIRDFQLRVGFKKHPRCCWTAGIFL